MSHQTILVLDFGSQFTQLIARRLRELSVYSEILPFNTPLETIRAKTPVGIILSGGPKSVSESDAPKCDPRVLDLGLPTLGICYGMQLMTDMLGGQVAPSPHREFGFAAVSVACQRRAAPVPRVASRSARVGQSWRLRGRGAAGVRRRRDQRERAGGRDGSARPRLLRAAVPSGSGAHRARRRDPAELRVRRVRLPRRLDDRLVHRRIDWPDSPAGRRRPRRLRAVGRRRLDGRRDA